MGEVPDWVIHPTAGGTGIYAMWKGYQELLSLGWIDRARNSDCCASGSRCADRRRVGKGFGGRRAHRGRAKHVAESIQVGNPVSLGWRALAAIRESKGTAAAVSDEEIVEAQELTGYLAGIFAEPAAATSVAVAKKLRDTGMVGKDDVVVCNLTGHGLKQPEAIRCEEELAPIAATLDALRERISRASETER